MSHNDSSLPQFLDDVAVVERGEMRVVGNEVHLVGRLPAFLGNLLIHFPVGGLLVGMPSRQDVVPDLSEHRRIVLLSNKSLRINCSRDRQNCWMTHRRRSQDRENVFRLHHRQRDCHS